MPLPSGRSPDPSPQFATTRWSLVLAAGDDASSSHFALGQLCTAYWYPIYYFVRRQGHSIHDAQDLTQEFFARLLDKNWLALADPSRGRFRSFLLVVLKRFLAGEWHRAQARKRAADRPHIPLEDAETRYLRCADTGGTAEESFDKQWAFTLLERAVQALRAEYEQDGRGPTFDALKSCLTTDPAQQPYARLADTLGLSEGAVKVAVHRLRERYRAKLRAEIAQTVSAENEVDSEMRYLVRVLSQA